MLGVPGAMPYFSTLRGQSVWSRPEYVGLALCSARLIFGGGVVCLFPMWFSCWCPQARLGLFQRQWVLLTFPLVIARRTLFLFLRWFRSSCRPSGGALWEARRNSSILAIFSSHCRKLSPLVHWWSLRQQFTHHFCNHYLGKCFYIFYPPSAKINSSIGLSSATKIWIHCAYVLFRWHYRVVEQNKCVLNERFCDAATQKTIQYNTCSIVFSTVMFSSTSTSLWIKNSYFRVMMLAFSGSVHLMLYFIFLVYIFVDPWRCDQYSAKVYGIFTSLLWSLRSSIVCIYLGMINQVDYELCMIIVLKL